VAVPAAAGFAGTSACYSGVISRTATFGRDPGTARSVQLQVIVERGAQTVSAFVTIHQAGKVHPISTASSIHRRKLLSTPVTTS